MAEFNDVFDEELDLDDIVSGEETVIEDEIDEIFSEEEVIDNKKEIQTSALDDILSEYGFKDSKIKIIDEDNSEKEINFHDLKKDEQLEILRNIFSQKDLNESEEKFLTDLRKQNLTVEAYLSKYKDDILEKAQVKSEPIYEIDNYDDQELFVLDLKSKFPDLTDEELVSELEKELKNEELFKKKTTSLRSEYKKLEDQYKENEKSNLIKEQEDRYNQFSDKMVEIAIKTPEFYGIELEDNDKNEVLSYLLDLDDNGVSDFYKDLNTPEKLYEAAWFLKYGSEAFNALRDAYQKEIDDIKKKK